MRVALFVRFFFWLWFAAALAAGYYRWLQPLPGAATLLLLAALTAVLVAVYVRSAALRTWVDGLDLRSLVLVHVTRFVGIYLLVLYQRGELPRTFAVSAGIGDIVVAAMALPVALAPLEFSARLRAIVIWNVVGFVDLLLVLFTATRIAVADPSLLRSFTALPLSLLPNLLVPLLLATHVIIFLRVVRERPRS